MKCPLVIQYFLALSASSTSFAQKSSPGPASIQTRFELGTNPTLTMPNAIDVEHCVESGVLTSVEPQFPPSVKDQGDLGTCWGQAFTEILEAYAYRKTGKHLSFSAESNVCRFMAQKSPESMLKKMQTVPHVVDNEDPTEALNRFKAGEWPLVHDSEATKRKLTALFAQVDQLNLKGWTILTSGGLTPTEEQKIKLAGRACKAFADGWDDCRVEAWQPPTNFFSDMAIESYAMSDPSDISKARMKLLSEVASNQRWIDPLLAERAAPIVLGDALEGCKKSSGALFKIVTKNLCLGIPMLASIVKLDGLETAPQNSQAYKKTGSLVNHALVLTGVERDPNTKKTFYIFKNSRGVARAKVRLPLDEGCYIADLTWVTSAEDRTRKTKLSSIQPEPEYPAATVPRH